MWGSRVECRVHVLLAKVQVDGFLLPLFHNDRLWLFEPENALPKLVEDRREPDTDAGLLVSRELGDGWTSEVRPCVDVNRGR